MRYIVHFEAAKKRNSVSLHVWDPAGDVRDIEGHSTDSIHFRFEFNMNTDDPRNIYFKCRFPGEGDQWEPDHYIRHIPTPDAREIWIFDYSPRCLTEPPEGPELSQINFHVLTRNKYKGGHLFVWNPSSGKSAMFTEKTRDDSQNTSLFEVSVKPWMKKGFHFKLVRSQTKDGYQWDEYEDDRYNRVWRPSDGDECWLKSGQVFLRKSSFMLEETTIELIYPRSMTTIPVMKIKDEVDDFMEEISSAELAEFYGKYYIARRTISIYPDSPYWVEFYGEGIIDGNGNSGWFFLPLTIDSTDTRRTFTTILGLYHWLEETPARNAQAQIIIHPNPQSGFGPSIKLKLRPGYSPTARSDSRLEAYESIEATKQSDNTWKAEFAVFSDTPLWIDLLSSIDENIIESRPDGPFMSQRRFQVKVGETATLLTMDGIGGFADEVTTIKEVSRPRKEVLASVFGWDIVNAGVFENWEMSHGATILDDQVWFALYAPHAVKADLMVLEANSPTDEDQRSVRMYPLKLTPDLRYYWCSIPMADFPDPNEIRYRFLLNNKEEVVDPASREVTYAESLWVRPGQDTAWSIVKDINTISTPFHGSPWRTPDWEWLIIYELHALRFTRRNIDISTGTPLPAFEQIKCELQPGKYLKDLGVTAVEILPVSEFPHDISWGYNSSLFFTVESSYGGADGFAQCVRACHDAGKAVLLDVVYNHLSESPLQAVARDVYADGETQWGDMVNYDHPVVIEFFRQAFLYMWRTFHLDGYRLDATLAIVDGHINNGYIIKSGHTGSGRGFEFLETLHGAIHNAADAEGKPWPYIVAENDPNNYGIDYRAVDGQWDFGLQYPLGEAACNKADKAIAIKDVLNGRRSIYEMVRYAESHDAVSGQESWKKRMVSREAWGHGMRMAKAIGTVSLLSKGIPMLFMGEEAAEYRDFNFGMDNLSDPSRYLDLDHYLDSSTENKTVLGWFQNLFGLRKNSDNGFGYNDTPYVGWGNKTVSFTRNGGRFFVIATMGTPDTQQNLGWLGLPPNGSYKEIFNSSWPVFQVDYEAEHTNGSYNARLNSYQNINLPNIGAIVLERV